MGKNLYFGRCLCALGGMFLSFSAAVTLAAPADVYLNEVFFNPPGNAVATELQKEYIELRGAPGASLENHWLVIVENEDMLGDDQTGTPGTIDMAVDLTGHSLGSNGYLLMRRAGNPFTPVAGTPEVTLPDTQLEGSGGTFMLIYNDGGIAPNTAGLDLDDQSVNDNDSNPATLSDGLDNPNGQIGWQILDSIGLFGEAGEAGTGRVYSPTVFGPEKDGQTIPILQGGPIFHASEHIEPDATYVGLGYEIEYLARYGDSTGTGPKDWHISNLTDNNLAGPTGAAILRQSGGDPHGYPRPNGKEVESNQFVPYGTNMTDTLGASNYPLNQLSLPWDYNQDGTVNAADYTVWRDTLGTVDPTGKSILANSDQDGSVDQTDYDAWKWHFGESLPGSGSGALGSSVPEPATLLLVAVGGAIALMLRSKSARRVC